MQRKTRSFFAGWRPKKNFYLPLTAVSEEREEEVERGGAVVKKDGVCVELWSLLSE